jgi:hypothetical protein
MLRAWPAKGLLALAAIAACLFVTAAGANALCLAL